MNLNFVSRILLPLVAISVSSPAVFGANANLFVSAENSQFDNYMSGPQVIEVVVFDSDINDTDEAKVEPDVTVNGKILRMVQAVDGAWYGYFADRNMAMLADSTVGLAGVGLDYGEFCVEASTIIGVDLSDTDGFAIPRDIISGSNGIESPGACTGTITASDSYINHIVREARELNTNPTIPSGQIGVEPNAWPFIQLYDLNPTGNVVVQYNKGGGVQTTTLTFDTVEDFAGLELDRAVYTPGAEVHFTLTDIALNIDPTDEDSWTFGTNDDSPIVVYQAFNEDGQTDADGTTGAVNIFANVDRDDLMFDDNGQLLIDVSDPGSAINVLNLTDNDIQEIIPGEHATDAISAGGSFGIGSQPVTIKELGPNSGIFSGSDESNQSNLRVRMDTLRGKAATIDYNEDPVTVLTGFHTGSLDIQPIDDDWNSGEEIPVVIVDHDLNKNSRKDEDLDLSDPEVASIPSLQIGNPFTLENLESARLAGVELVVDEVQTFSQRAMLRVSSEDIPITDRTTLVLTLRDTYADLYQSINNPSGSFSGFNFLNYDIRSFELAIGINAIDIGITDGVNSLQLSSEDSQALINLNQVIGDDLFGMNTNAKVTIIFTFKVSGNPIVPSGRVLPIVCDFFSFGQIDDGSNPEDRISNIIVRLELEETGDNSGTFEGSLKFTMLNQLNVLTPTTYEVLRPIADAATFIIPGVLVEEDAPRVNYLEIIADGLLTRRADQEEVRSHSGTVSLNKDTYRPGETVVVTLEDPDLNLDSDLIDIYTVVSPSRFPNDPARDTVGKPGLETIGRLLEVTFDDLRWTSGLTENDGVCGEAGFPDDGLAATGFTLVETRANTGIFEGTFRIPDTYCNSTTGKIESTAGVDVEVNYNDFSDASGFLVEVGDSADSRTSTGSVALDRSVYPMPFGSVNDFFPDETQTDASMPNGDSLFPVHLTGITADGDQNIDATTEEVGPRDVVLHIRVTDPDFNQSHSKRNGIGLGDHGPVTVSIVRELKTLILATAGGSTPNFGVITSGPDVIPGVTRELGPILETELNSGIYEFDLAIRYTDGPGDVNCPDTPDLGYSSLNGEAGLLGRFNEALQNGSYCILQGDILQIDYHDPADASGKPNTVTDSATFDIQNGVLQSDKSVYTLGSDMILTLIEPDLDLDSDRQETYSLDLIEWQSDAATLTLGERGGETDAFAPEPRVLRETGDSTGIFQTVIAIPDRLKGSHLTLGEEIRLQYTDWGSSGSGYVGDESRDINRIIFSSNFGATIELDQKAYSWTDKVFITVVAPDWNRNSDVIEVIGGTDLNPVTITTRNFQLEKYTLAETGTDTAIFFGEIVLTGFLHDADGDPQTGGASGFDTRPRTSPLAGGGPTNGFIQSDHDDAIIVSFEFSPGEKVVGSALVRWNLGDIQWLESSYRTNDIGTIRVIDRDMNLNPEIVDSFTLSVSSTTDPSGIRVLVQETNEATGIFEADIQFTTTEDSRASILRVTPGDFVFARYDDHTLPDPHPPSEHQRLIATTRVGSPPADPAPIHVNNPRVEDASGNRLDEISVNQQVLISIDVANSLNRDQEFMYFVQVRNEQTLIESLGWITGSLLPGQGFAPALSWTPTSPGRFEATLFFWESIDNPIPLTKPQTLSIQVN